MTIALKLKKVDPSVEQEILHRVPYQVRKITSGGNMQGDPVAQRIAREHQDERFRVLMENETMTIYGQFDTFVERK